MGPWTFLCLSFLLVLGVTTEGFADHQSPRSLFVFGDSAVDTGNTPEFLASSWKPPYGITFPGKPAGRYSDGRLLTDFVASYLGIPSPVPYKVRRAPGNRKRFGMNFAYSGTGVFDTFALLPNLTTQIDFFQQLLQQGAYKSSELSSSVALVSAASNDYAAYLLNNGTTENLNEFIVKLVNQMAVDLRRLTGLGLKRIAILGLEPIGCLPVVTQLNSFSSCIDLVNQFVTHHNSLLRSAVDAINAPLRHPSQLTILDLYTPLDSIFQGHNRTGFVDPLKPCCVGVSSNITACGSTDEHGNPLYKVCDKPSASFYWDLVHPTQSGWSAVFPFFIPALKQLLS